MAGLIWKSRCQDSQLCQCVLRRKEIVGGPLNLLCGFWRIPVQLWVRARFGAGITSGARESIYVHHLVVAGCKDGKPGIEVLSEYLVLGYRMRFNRPDCIAWNSHASIRPNTMRLVGKEIMGYDPAS